MNGMRARGSLGFAFIVLVWACDRQDSAGAGVVDDVSITMAPDTLVSMGSGVIGGVSDILVAADGSVYLADAQSSAIHLLDPGGHLVRTIGRAGAGPGEFSRPSSLAHHGDTLAVVDWGNGRVQFLDSNGAPRGTLSLPPGPAPPTLGPGWLILSPTWGIDTVLAIVRGPDHAERARIGRIEGVPSNRIRLSELKKQIAEGGVPDIFLNSADAVAGEAGEIWLAVPARAQVAQFDSLGSPRWSMELAEPAFDEVRARFISANAEAGPNSLWPLRYILDTQVVGTDLWVLLGQSAYQGAAIRIVRGDGTVGPLLSWSAVSAVERFAVDPDRRLIYFTRPETAELLRSRF